MAESTITSKGQTTVPAEVRALVHAKPGTRLIARCVGDGRTLFFHVLGAAALSLGKARLCRPRRGPSKGARRRRSAHSCCARDQALRVERGTAGLGCHAENPEAMVRPQRPSASHHERQHPISPSHRPQGASQPNRRLTFRRSVAALPNLGCITMNLFGNTQGESWPRR